MSSEQVRVIENAIISPYSVEAFETRERRVCSAVYSDGVIVPESQGVSGRGGDLVVLGDPPTFEAKSLPSVQETLSGSWLFGGPFMAQFGHFLLETVTTLWPLGKFDGVVFTPFLFGTQIAPWHQTLLSRLQPNVPFKIVAQGAVVEKLTVAERPVVLNESVGDNAVGTWDRIA